MLILPGITSKTNFDATYDLEELLLEAAPLGTNSIFITKLTAALLEVLCLQRSRVARALLLHIL